MWHAGSSDGSLRNNTWETYLPNASRYALQLHTWVWMSLVLGQLQPCGPCKRWAIMFYCMTSRAVELIKSMDAWSCLNALRRFFTTRRPAKRLWSDCGTNFICASKELRMGGSKQEPIQRPRQPPEPLSVDASHTKDWSPTTSWQLLYTKQWRQIQVLANQFWTRSWCEYLPDLQLGLWLGF